MVSAICPLTSRVNVSAWMPTASGPSEARICEARANRKSPVRIAIVLVHRELALWWPRRMDRLVHHVVVVQGGQMGQLDRGRGRDHARIAGIAELRGEQDQGGPEPFPAGLEQVGGRLGQQFLLGPCRVGQLLLDQGKPVNDLRGQRGVGQLNRDGGDQSGSWSSVIAAVTDHLGRA